ncbi:MAG: hypothetical protein RLZZ292_3704, partial [Bacteroidota bacterium]
MKQLFIFFFALSLFSCQSKQRVTDTPSPIVPVIDTSMSWSDSIQNARKVRKFKLDSVWRIYNAQIPMSNPKSLFKKLFYKHYTGTFGNEKAELNLTLGYFSMEDSLMLKGTLIVGETRRLIKLESSRQDMRDLDSLRVGFYAWRDIEWNEKAPDIRQLKGIFEEKNTIFKGIAIDEQNFLPVAFSFKETYQEGTVPLEVMVYRNIQKWKGVTSRYLFSSIKGKKTNNTPYFLLPNSNFKSKNLGTEMDYAKVCK